MLGPTSSEPKRRLGSALQTVGKGECSSDRSLVIRKRSVFSRRGFAISFGALLLVLAGSSALPPAAPATVARSVGQISMSPIGRYDYAVAIGGASRDGRHLLLTEYGDAAPPVDEHLWALDTMLHTATPLAGLSVHSDASRPHYSLSPDGKWAAWATSSPHHGCDNEAHVASTDTQVPSRTILLPPPYAARSGITAMTAAAGGRVTVRVSRCSSGFESQEAILSAGPGATRFRVEAGGPLSDSDYWPVSQDGRVFATCQKRKRPSKRSIATLTVVVSDPVLKVKTVSLTYGHDSYQAGDPSCLASDAGTATMTVVQNRHSVHYRASHLRHWERNYRVAGVTVGGRHAARFRLPWGLMIKYGGLQATSPTRGRVLLEGWKVLRQNPTTGSVRRAKDIVRLVRTVSGHYTRGVGSAGVFSGDESLPINTADRSWSEGLPYLFWDPFAPAILGISPTRSSGAKSRSGRTLGGTYSLSVFNPKTLKSSRSRIAPGGGRSNFTACFLPSGRLLVEATHGAYGGSRHLFYMSNRSRSRFRRLDTSQLGAVSSISCGAAGSGEVFFATADGRVFEVPGGTMDNSPLSVLR